MKPMETLNTKIIVVLQALFALYMYALFKIILFKFGYINFAFLWHQLQRSPAEIARRLVQGNFVPLDTISNTFDTMTGHALLNLIGNVALFMPYGLFLALLSRNKRMSGTGAFVRALGLSLVLECAQGLFSIGTFDVDDLILNTFGGLLGFGLFRICYKVKKDQPATQA